MTLGESIRNRRKEIHITAIELAARVGISQTSMSLIEKGQTIPRGDTLLKIAAILRTSVAMLWFQCLDESDFRGKDEIKHLIKLLVNKL